MADSATASPPWHRQQPTTCDEPIPVAHWGMGTRQIKPCIKAARAAGVSIPTMDNSKNACLTWHFKGFCNSTC